LYWRLAEDGALLLKYIAGIMFMDNLQLFYNLCAYVGINNYKHSAQNAVKIT